MSYGEVCVNTEEKAVYKKCMMQLKRRKEDEKNIERCGGSGN